MDDNVASPLSCFYVQLQIFSRIPSSPLWPIHLHNQIKHPLWRMTNHRSSCCFPDRFSAGLIAVKNQLQPNPAAQQLVDAVAPLPLPGQPGERGNVPTIDTMDKEFVVMRWTKWRGRINFFERS